MMRALLIKIGVEWMKTLMKQRYNLCTTPAIMNSPNMIIARCAIYMMAFIDLTQTRLENFCRSSNVS